MPQYISSGLTTEEEFQYSGSGSKFIHSRQIQRKEAGVSEGRLGTVLFREMVNDHLHSLIDPF